MFTGYTNVTFRMLPLSTYKIKINLVPTKTGRLLLPKLGILQKADINLINPSLLKIDQSFGFLSDPLHEDKIFFPSSDLSFNSGVRHRGDLYVYVEP
jgi:hypothetical protein